MEGERGVFIFQFRLGYAPHTRTLVRTVRYAEAHSGVFHRTHKHNHMVSLSGGKSFKCVRSVFSGAREAAHSSFTH